MYLNIVKFAVKKSPDNSSVEGLRENSINQKLTRKKFPVNCYIIKRLDDSEITARFFFSSVRSPVKN